MGSSASWSTPSLFGVAVAFLDKVSSICHPNDLTSRKARSMEYDVDLLRELMFSLEARQQSPRATVVLALVEEAVEFGRTPAQVAECLDALLALEYIDGTGHDEEPGYWLFRKLTRKGAQFVRATRAPRDWERMKRHFETRHEASR